MKTKKIIFLTVAMIYMAYLIVPAFSQTFVLPAGTVNIIMAVVSFVLYPKAISNRVMVWLFLYFVALELLSLSGHGIPPLGIGSVEESKRIIIEMAFFLPIASILCVLNHIRDYDVMGKMRWCSIILLAISFLFIVMLVMADPGILRAEESEIGLEKVRILGLPNYTLMHAYIFIVPGLLYIIRYAKKSYIKLPMLFFLLVTFYVIINTQITTAMILVIFFLVFYFVYDIKDKQRSTIKIVGFIFVLMFVNELGVFRMLADYLVQAFDGTAAQSKMEDFQNAIYGNDTAGTSNLEGRETRHLQSLITFFDNMLVGNINELGGHSYLLDRLGGMGLFGFVPFIMLLYHLIKLSYKLVTNVEQKSFFVVTILSLFVFIYEKGLFGQEGFLFSLIIAPCLLTYIPQKEETN